MDVFRDRPCPGCNRELPEDAYGIHKRDGRYSRCKECCRTSHRTKRIAARKRALDYYGGACQCFGEAHYEFLAIDHIDGGGTEHRKVMKEHSIHLWLQRNKFPPGFRVLCHNCNTALGIYGYCPHQS